MYTKPTFWDKFKSAVGVPRYQTSDYKPPKAIHEPIRLAEIKQRILVAVNKNLITKGFSQPSKSRPIWIKRRTENIYDCLSLQFDPSPTLGQMRVLLGIGYHAPEIERWTARLASEKYDPTSSTDGGYCYQVNPEERKTEWVFWNTHYQESEKDDLIFHINTFGIPFLEKVSSYQELLAFIERSEGPFGIERAILNELTGNKQKALEILESNKKDEIEKYADTIDQWKQDNPTWTMREKLINELKSV